MHVIDGARVREAVALLPWRRRADNGAVLPGHVIADIVESILEELASVHRLTSLLHCELVQAAGRAPELRSALGVWQADRLALLRDLTRHWENPQSEELATALQALVTDELAFSLALGEQVAYRWLRRLCVRRLVEDMARPPAPWALGAFETFYAELGDGASSPSGLRYEVRALAGDQRAMAACAGAIVLESGAEAVTHRAVAQRAGLAYSTLAYHFPRQHDLLMAGLEAIIVDAQARTDGAGGQAAGGLDIAVSTFAIAVASIRHVNLRPFAADMRRRRGENLFRLVQQRQGPGAPDRLTIQAIALISVGDVLLARSSGRPIAPNLGMAMLDAYWPHGR